VLMPHICFALRQSTYKRTELRIDMLKEGVVSVTVKSSLWGRVARWFLFKPKIPILDNFGGPYIGKCW
jgi:hypothetical protein